MNTLYYILDPMCSWCYAFAPTWKKLLEELPKDIRVVYVLGGLAPHSNEPMPKDMQTMLQDTWKQIQQRIGTVFNFDFWTVCTPRRSTYLACQACIAARVQDKEFDMIKAIQREYYLNASNPSNRIILEKAAKNIGLDMEKFSNDLESSQTINSFQKDLNNRQELGINGFPSLVLMSPKGQSSIAVLYNEHKTILTQIKSKM